MTYCPRCGKGVRFDATTWYHCNPDAFPTRRAFGFLCYSCHAVVFVCEDGKLDVHLLKEHRWAIGESPKFDVKTGKPTAGERHG